jgi:hypothetical protein
MLRIEPLAQEHVVVCESPDPKHISVYSPGILRLTSGRLIATTDWGSDGVEALAGQKMTLDDGQRYWQGRVCISDDGGITWHMTTTFPFMHARPFEAGGKIYILGHANDLRIICSEDAGRTWSQTYDLTEGERWHQAPCNVHYANGCVYLVMEQRLSFYIKGWYVGEMAPVLMRARVEDDLTQRESWTFASRLPFLDVIDNEEDCPQLNWHGIPFYACPYPSGGSADGVEERNCAPIGWLETNVVQFVDPDHYWTDPEGKTLHLWMRAHTGGTGYACIAKVVEQGHTPGTGLMKTEIETVPSGKQILYVPCPGGQMKFHVLYDETSRLYWLLSTQATDSMTRASRLPDNRFNLPNNERRRLQIHFSKNMVDWCFAGLVAVGKVEHASRHYASMAIDGNDLIILSRSGDYRAKSAHDGNLITFHRIKDFRTLIY